MFENLRRSLNDLLDKATRPEERHAIASRMRDTLVQAKVGIQDLREALERSRQRLEHERRELETIRRRKVMAESIADQETVRLATKYEQMHAERIAVLERKLEAQESEFALAEREVAEMTAEMKAAMSGVGAGSAAQGAYERRAAEELEEELNSEPVRQEIDGLARQRSRSEREAAAQRQLDELKRRMGK